MIIVRRSFGSQVYALAESIVLLDQIS